jgi:TRAP transporter TAXI family solute receptor
MKFLRFVKFLALFSTLVMSTHAEASTAIGMVTGSKTGTYIAFGKDMARIAEKNGVTINVLDSKGSIDNIRRITSKEKAGLAIVQSDVLGFLSRSKNPESMEIANKLRLVVPFYNEEVHILARKNITSLSDLNGKRVVVGSEGSGSMITSVNLFSILGIAPGQMFKIEPPQGVVAVLNGEVDAVIFVGGKPVKMFKNMEGIANIKVGPNAGKLEQVHFLPIDDKRLLGEYNPAAITSSDYSFVTENVPTVSVTSLLVTFDYTRKNDPYYKEQCQNMAKLVAALRDNLIELKSSGHPKWKEVDLAATIGNWKRDECTASVIDSLKTLQNETKSDSVPVIKKDTNLENDLLNVIRGSDNKK